MAKLFKKVLFGYKPDEVNAKIDTMTSEKEKEIDKFQTLRKEAELQIKEQEQIIADLKRKIEELNERERAISEVMIIAQKNAERVREEALQKAQTMLEESEEKVTLKTLELESLRTRVNNFREEFCNILDKYQLSLEELDLEKMQQIKWSVTTSDQ